MKYSTFLALRYIKPQKNKIFSYISKIVAVVGICIGVASLIVTVGIMTGFHREIRLRLMLMYPHIIITGRTDIPKEKFEHFQEIANFSPFIYSQVILKNKDIVYTTVVKGIDYFKEQSIIDIDKTILEKKGNPIDKFGILVGKELAKNMYLSVGDEIVMVLPTQVYTPFGTLPMTQKFVVQGIFRSGIYEYDSNLCYINYYTAREIFTDSSTGELIAVQGYGIKLKNDKYLHVVVNKLQNLLGFAYKVLSWEQLNYNLFSALKLEKIVMIIVVSLTIIVACFIIITNILFTGIQKSKDVGILMSMGATKNEILKIFFINGMILNVTGIVSGSFLGFILSWLIKKYQFIKLPKEIYYIDKIPVYFSIPDIILILSIATFVGFVASIYPARKISQFDPLEIIRYG